MQLPKTGTKYQENIYLGKRKWKQRRGKKVKADRIQEQQEMKEHEKTKNKTDNKLTSVLHW